MPKFVVKVRPTGLLNGQEWPEVGEKVDLPAGVAADMVDAGVLERPAEKKVEKRPASKKAVETR